MYYIRFLFFGKPYKEQDLAGRAFAKKYPRYNPPGEVCIKIDESLLFVKVPKHYVEDILPEEFFENIWIEFINITNKKFDEFVYPVYNEEDSLTYWRFNFEEFLPYWQSTGFSREIS